MQAYTYSTVQQIHNRLFALKVTPVIAEPAPGHAKLLSTVEPPHQQYNHAGAASMAAGRV
jgi:hypothetical protein